MGKDIKSYLKKLNICIGMDEGFGRDDGCRHEKIAEALVKEIRDSPSITYQIKNLDRHDWLEVVEPFDVIIWWPGYMGPQPTSLFKEKIYFLENFLNKLVVPNYSSIWHFESKIAQSYLFQYAGIKTPRTVVSFDYHDALVQLNAIGVPIVIKKSFGSASNNVRLIKDEKKASWEIDSIFYQHLWKEKGEKSKSLFTHLTASITNRWFWKKLWLKLVDDISLGKRFGNVYIQEFIPGNKADLRITAIGDRFAFGFWRNNRPGDFRASGSGRIDYNRLIPKEIIFYCLGISKKLGFDSMAYDIIFQDQNFFITEMSFSYLPEAIYNAKGYYEIDDTGDLFFHPQHTWPQELWVKWALIRAGYSEPEINN